MKPNRLTPAYVLSAIIAGLALIVSVGGLLIPNLYRTQNTFALTSALGNDAVTLVLAVPLLVAALVFAAGGSQRGQLALLGMLNYMLYNFGFYVFGFPVNLFFPAYVALFVLSAYALIFGLTRLNAPALASRFRPRTPARWIAGYMMITGVALGTFWLSQWVRLLATGQPPQVAGNEDFYKLIAAMDLSIVVPSFLLGAVWLWLRRPWGYILAVMANVNAGVYMLVLIATALAASRAAVKGAMDPVPSFAVAGIASTICAALLIRNLQAAHRQAAAA